jgi:alkaline phosphatase D
MPGALATPASPRRLTDPFTLGIASGDPTPDGVVLWTRLAPKPLAEDGSGGMPARNVPVKWELAEDEKFSKVVRRDVTDATPEFGHSVHVELDGLQPGREYFYRFRVGDHISPTGRTRTAPALDASDLALTMCFASCAQYEHGYFTAYRRLAEENPDLVLHLGDYQYEYKADVYVAPDGNVRDHKGPETETLANYRQRHAQYKTDADLQAAHAVAPWLVVWDDHELDNNWADEAYEKPEKPQPNFLERRKAAFQAYYENMPLRRTSIPSGIDMQLYRRVQWGQLATFHMLDTRQYRDDQACGDGAQAGCDERLDSKRTITGDEQERWLLDGFRNSNARWDLLGQQVWFAQMDMDSGPSELLNMDSWDGYVASRDRIMEGFSGLRNPVVLTGDVHSHWANNLKADFNDPDSKTVGAELVATSISTLGDGAERTEAGDEIKEANPHVQYYSYQRGYVRTRITGSEIRADFRSLPYVQKPGAPASTKASFVIEDRNPGLNPA